MPVVVMAMLIASVLGAVAFEIAMLVKDKPLHGMLGLLVLAGPASALTFIYVGLTTAD